MWDEWCNQSEARKPMCLHTCCSRGAGTIEIPWMLDRRAKKIKKTNICCVLFVTEALKPVQFLQFFNGGQITARKPLVFVYGLKQRRWNHCNSLLFWWWTDYGRSQVHFWPPPMSSFKAYKNPKFVPHCSGKSHGAVPAGTQCFAERTSSAT